MKIRHHLPHRQALYCGTRGLVWRAGELSQNLLLKRQAEKKFFFTKKWIRRATKLGRLLRRRPIFALFLEMICRSGGGHCCRIEIWFFEHICRMDVWLWLWQWLRDARGHREQGKEQEKGSSQPPNQPDTHARLASPSNLSILGRRSHRN